MTKRIFRSILLAVLAVLLASLVIILGLMYEYFAGVQESQLKDELGVAAAAVETGGEDYLAALDSLYRFTWIAPDGSVLYDTGADSQTLENHAERTEVRDALRSGEGESVRYSSTLLEKTMYYARRLDDGSVLRVSVGRATVGVLLLGMLQPILVVLAAALILSALLAKQLSARIVRPLNTLDLDHPLENDVYEELSPLLGRLARQRRQIDAQLRELQRHADEFAQITASMREGLVLLDDAGRVLSINPAARRLFAADDGCVGQDFLTVDRSAGMSRAIAGAMADGHSETRSERGGRVWQFDVSRIDSGGAAAGAVLLASRASSATSVPRRSGSSRSSATSSACPSWTRAWSFRLKRSIFSRWPWRPRTICAPRRTRGPSPSPSRAAAPPCPACGGCCTK